MVDILSYWVITCLLIYYNFLSATYLLYKAVKSDRDGAVVKMDFCTTTGVSTYPVKFAELSEPRNTAPDAVEVLFAVFVTQSETSVKVASTPPD